MSVMELKGMIQFTAWIQVVLMWAFVFGLWQLPDDWYYNVGIFVAFIAAYWWNGARLTSLLNRIGSVK